MDASTRVRRTYRTLRALFLLLFSEFERRKQKLCYTPTASIKYLILKGFFKLVESYFLGGPSFMDAPY